MLIKELIARHVGPGGALHERGIRLDRTQMPSKILVHHDGEGAVATVSGDLHLVMAQVGTGLGQYVDPDLPLGATLLLLFEVEVTELPVDRILVALTEAKLQVVEATVVSGLPTATVAVVATRTDEMIVPDPSLAQSLEPGDHEGLAVLRRLLGERVLVGLVQPARERELVVRVGELEARLAKVTAEHKKLQTDSAAREGVLVRERDTARKEADAERKHLAKLRSSRSFKVASQLNQVSGVARRIIRRPGSGKPLE